MTEDHLTSWVETLTRGVAVDGSVTIAATIGGDRVVFDHLHRALAARIVALENRSGDQAIDGAYDAGAKFAERCLDADNRQLLHDTLAQRRGQRFQKDARND